MQTSAHTWCEQNDGGDDQRADDQDDQQSDGDSLPVPLWRATANQLLSNTQKQTCKRLKVKFVQCFLLVLCQNTLSLELYCSLTTIKMPFMGLSSTKA